MDADRERRYPFADEDSSRYRIGRALRAVEDALVWLERTPAEGIDVRALHRVREDLAILLRTITRELE
jgi:hypothetical protein